MVKGHPAPTDFVSPTQIKKAAPARARRSTNRRNEASSRQ
nr:MAG TPA: hypothetical protein [Caudoviricetes sp.]